MNGKREEIKLTPQPVSFMEAMKQNTRIIKYIKHKIYEVIRRQRAVKYLLCWLTRQATQKAMGTDYNGWFPSYYYNGTCIYLTFKACFFHVTKKLRFSNPLRDKNSYIIYRSTYCGCIFNKKRKSLQFHGK